MLFRSLEAIESVMEAKRAESIGQFDLFGGQSASQSVTGVELDVDQTEWEKALLLTYEREMLGLYVSDHPLLGVEHVLRNSRDYSINQLFEDVVGHESVVTIAGLISSVQRKVSRQGNSWAIVTIEDLEGAVDVLFYSNSYQQFATQLIEDRIVVVRGRIDKKDKEEIPRVTAIDLSIPDINQAPIGQIGRAHV